MGFLDYFRKKSPDDLDAELRTKLTNLVLNALSGSDGRIHAEDAISASATIVGERCIDLAGDFSLRDHDLTPGSRAFSTRANELICGDDANLGIDQVSKDSIVGVLRHHLGNKAYADSDFPNLVEVFRGYAAGIGDSSDWGKVPLTVPKEHHPFIPPLQIGFQMRHTVDTILHPVREDRVRCLKLAAESLAEILNMVASAMDHKLALLLAIETINGMAKTAPMTESAMRKVQAGN